MPDYFEGTSYFGGSFNANTNSATFRISEYMQDIIQGKLTENGLSLGITGGSYNAHRLIVNGPGVEDNRIRVEMTYSIVQE